MSTAAAGTGERHPAAPGYALTLYVSGARPRSQVAIETLRRICDVDMAGRAELQVIDISDEPARVSRDGIVAVPTLVRRLPVPVRMMVGDFSDIERVRAGLDLGPRKRAAVSAAVLGDRR